MSEIRETLLKLNPVLFEMRQPSKEHTVLIVGRKAKDAEGKFYIEYELDTKPSAAALKANVKVQKFLHAAFKPINTIEVDENGKRSLKGPKKAKVSNVFLNTQPELYNFIVQAINEGEGKGYVNAGIDALKRPIIQLRDTMWGNKINFNTDLYVPHSLNAKTGRMEPLMPTTFNTKTGEYKPTKTTLGNFEFFADEDDLDKLLETCARHYTKRVAPWVTAKTITTKIQGSKTEVAVEEVEMTGINEPLLDTDGNIVDDEGNIITLKEDIPATE